jgi:hypothetical protein
VFRVPQEHDGKGLVCPSCRRLLRLPRPGEETAPLVLARSGGLERTGFRKESGDEGQAEEGTRRRRVRKRRSRKDKDRGLVWEHDTQGPARLRRVERTWMNRALIAGAAALVVTLVFVWREIGNNGGGTPDTQTASPEPPPPAAEGAATGEDRPTALLLTEAEPMARAFLEATTIEDMAKVVRNPDVALERMRREYPEGRIEPLGMAEFNCTGIPEREPGLTVILVRTRDYEMKRLNFVDTPDGVRIDWESWAGWCEMPWDEFIAQRPTEPQLFRVVIRESKYYNYDFADDGKWRAFSVESWDGERMLYAYVERGSPIDETLHLDPDLDGELMMLKLRYPAEATPGNQVIIDEVVQKGWVEFLPAQAAAPEE